MAQTSNGYLWIGTLTGLYKFDGVRFEAFSMPDGSHPITSDVSALYSDSSGLWVGMRLGGAYVIQGDHLTRYDQSSGLPPHTVFSFARRGDGSMWAQTTVGLYHLESNTWKRADAQWGYPVQGGQSILVDSAGRLWARTFTATFLLPPGAHQFVQTEVPGGSGDLFIAPDAEVWAADPRRGLIDLTTPSRSLSPKQLGDSDPGVGGSRFDRDGALWTVIAHGQHILAARIVDLSRLMATNDSSLIETLEPGQPAKCSFEAFHVLEDREGNIWRATGTGIDRFRANKFHDAIGSRASLMRLRSMTVDREGAVWVLDAAHLLGFPPSQPSPIERQLPPLQNIMISGVLREPDGSFLIAREYDPPARLEGDSLEPMPLDAKIAGQGTQAILRDATGNLWMSNINAGLFEQHGAGWLRNGGFAQLPPEPPLALAADSNGRLWAGYVDGRLASIDQVRGVRWYGEEAGLAVGSIKALSHGRQNSLWVGGDAGVALFRNNRFYALRAPDQSSVQSASGIVQDLEGGLWINGGSGITHVLPAEVTAFESHPGRPVPVEIFNYEDGVDGTVSMLRPVPTAVLGGDGRVWFVTSTGAYWIDPRNIRRNRITPVPIVMSVVADNRRYPVDLSTELPRLTRNFQVQYTAPNLTMPDRVRFRYWLEGVDSGWQNAGTQRQASYTNVPPGVHVFHLAAANEDGLWNAKDVEVLITIPAMFYQTRWFEALCVGGGLVLIWQLIQYRLRQLESRLKERLKERERIARELHDTLIQGALGVIVSVQQSVTQLAKNDPLRPSMEQALDLADQLMKDARQRVTQLRSAEHRGDLVAAIRNAGGEVFGESIHRLSVNCKGKVRLLRAFVAEELYWIAREALSNARQHAGASRVEVEIAFAPDRLGLYIRDDGVGVAPDIITHGAGPSHHGIHGMRERAQLIGARFKMFSRAEAGVEIEVSVPASTAYVRASPRWRRVLASWRPATH
jgi:signal transduction histidine kinase